MSNRVGYMTLTVTDYDGGTVTASVGSRELMLLKRKYPEASLAAMDQMEMEWLLFLAWSALHREGLVSEGFDTWADRIGRVDADDVPGESPTIPQPSSQP